MNYSKLAYCALLFASLTSSTGCIINANTHKEDIQSISNTRALILNKAFSELVKKHKINTLGVAVIKDRQVIWREQYGFQSEGIWATKKTLFNLASLTKTVTAETVLRLVAKGKLSLDEPISPYWVDPDLKDSLDVKRLTARMLLTHKSGFLNWRYFSDDGKLSFINPPGTTFGYSGEGFEYLAKYAEKKLGKPFEEIVKSTIFEPLDMQSAAIGVHKKNFPRIAKQLNKDGHFYGYYCHPFGYCSKEGSYSAAANMVVTVDDYAKFLISSMHGHALNPELKQDRNTMQGVQFERSDIDCGNFPDNQCPIALGYGLGWGISQLKDNKLIGHRGTNWSTVSIAYYYQGTGDGLIIFINAPNKAGLAGMIAALELLDPDSPEIPGYKLRLARTN